METGVIVYSEDWKTLTREPTESKEEFRIRLLRMGKLTLHHIIPKKINPDLTNDKDNHILLPFQDHMNLHYWLWKYDKQYGPHLWFGCVFGRKYGLWDLPGGDLEYEELKRDVRERRKK